MYKNKEVQHSNVQRFNHTLKNTVLFTAYETSIVYTRCNNAAL